jgi:hypothetical protein
METGNPSQGRLRGRTDEHLVLTGEDKFYAKASELGRLFIPYENDQPLDYRVARHTESIMVFFEMMTLLDTELVLAVENIPSFEEIMEKGMGEFLSPLN